MTFTTEGRSWIGEPAAIESCILEFVTFVAIGVIGLVNETAIYLAIDPLGLHYRTARCVAAGFTFTFIFS